MIFLDAVEVVVEGGTAAAGVEDDNVVVVDDDDNVVGNVVVARPAGSVAAAAVVEKEGNGDADTDAAIGGRAELVVWRKGSKGLGRGMIWERCWEGEKEKTVWARKLPACAGAAGRKELCSFSLFSRSCCLKV